MNDSKKAPASAATLTGAVENGTACKTAHASTKNDTTDGAGRQLFRVSDLLHPGAENAIPRRELMTLTGLSDRELRLMIQKERLSGTPICANNKTGYYLPGSDQERAECVKSMRRRSAEIAKTADAIERGGDGA